MSSSKARENLTLELKIMSATDIRNVNIMSEMDVYALAWIDGEPNRRRPLFKSTPIAYSSGSNPTWNHHFKFSVNDRLALDGRLTLSVKPVSHRPLGGDRDIGQVDVPVLTLLLQNMPSLLINGDGAGMMSVSYPVRVVGGTKV
ncbi:PREDICTED: protein SRC2-like [Tarenaya hassleriana]|uniref:protein SRC2-like n=1 Tax=Tarenaya hassleriana TaxID=28532 RepID=UPI00053C126B|nr:PREDICTED: protein SRC2-like [Tarenaya hassleriana]